MSTKQLIKAGELQRKTLIIAMSKCRSQNLQMAFTNGMYQKEKIKNFCYYTRSNRRCKRFQVDDKAIGVNFWNGVVNQLSVLMGVANPVM